MTATEPDRIWWTAGELAEARLPELPGTKRGINLIAQREGWQAQPDRARKRPGRGGGWEYHWQLLPPGACRALLKAASEAPARPDRGTAWAAFDALPETAKQKAKSQLEAIRSYETLLSAGASSAAAAAEAARMASVSPRTLFNWIARIDGVAADDRLAYLVPQHRRAQRTPTDPGETRLFMDWLKTLYMRLEQPTFRECYRDAVKKAKRAGWFIPTERTARRTMEREVPRVTMVYAREGEAGLARCFPPQIRDVSRMQPMEMANADCHMIDVFVEWPDGTVNRPQIIGFQDVYSRKLLSWRVDHTPNKVMVMAAFGEMVENWGLPRGVLVDNGHEFANKWFTGGTPTRFRFKIVEDEPLGILPLLGIEVTWASPGHGQAKPIERTFRDFASNVAKDIRFAGAYVGNRPDAKPENYRERAIPIETFLRVLDERIAEHNAREGRLSQAAEGRSFDATFAEKYTSAPVRRATPEQQRIWLMAQHIGKLHKQNGQMRVHGNYYYSAWMSQIAGQEVVARFNPEDLHAGIHIYTKDGAYLGFAECRQKTGFSDMVEAKAHARRNQRIRRAEKQLLEAHRPIPIEVVAQDMEQAAERAADLSDKVVARITGPREAPANVYRPAPNPEIDASRDAMIVNMADRKPAAPIGWRAPTEPDQRWALYQDSLRRSEAGEPVGREEARWIESYRTSDEHEAFEEMERRAARNDTG